MEIKLLPVLLGSPESAIEESMYKLLEENSYQVESNLRKEIGKLLGQEIMDEMIPYVKDLLLDSGYIVNIGTHVTFKPEQNFEQLLFVYKLEKKVVLNKLVNIEKP